MNFQVEWLESATDDLARAWMQASDHQAVNDAADRIDDELQTDAHRKGVPIDNYRCFVSRPLVALYEVILDDGMVWIVQVRLTRT